MKGFFMSLSRNITCFFGNHFRVRVWFQVLPLFVLLFSCFAGASVSAAEGDISAYKVNFDAFRSCAEAQLKAGIPLGDYHVHIMNGGAMTSAGVAEYQKYTGICIGMVENAGRAWLLSDNEKISAFIDAAESAAYRENPNKKAFLIGIQVNDRDWQEAISPENLARLDYILGDTLIMMKPDGSPQPLWELPKDYDADPNVWMEGYFAHCMRVLEEPLTIWADPTWLPKFCEDKYDELWTDERLEALVEKAVKNGIAIEIQADSLFQRERFVRIAVNKGAKICFGMNNFDDEPNSLEKWRWFFENFKPGKEQFLQIQGKPQLHVSGK